MHQHYHSTFVYHSLWTCYNLPHSTFGSWPSYSKPPSCESPHISVLAHSAEHWPFPGPTQFQSRQASLRLVECQQSCQWVRSGHQSDFCFHHLQHNRDHCGWFVLFLSANLTVWSESDMMPWLCTLRRDNGRVSLSCVAWNGGTPSLHGRLALCCRRLLGSFGFLRLFDGVAGPFLCSWFPGSLFPVSYLSVLSFGPFLPVPHNWREMQQQM